MEFTFLRNDRDQPSQYVNQMPHDLNFDNVDNKPTMILPDIWYSK